MSVKRFEMNKAKVYNIISFALSIYLAASAIVFGIYLVAPLFGGKLFVKALIIYGSWIGMALLLKYVLKRAKQSLRIRGHEYLIVCLYTIGCMVLWFPYPFYIFLSILSVMGTALAYRANTTK